MARSLAHLYPTFKFLVQMNMDSNVQSSSSGQHQPDLPEQAGQPSFRIEVINRLPGTRQPAVDAAVYILHLPLAMSSAILAELQIHFGVLRMSGSSTLIPPGRLLPRLLSAVI